MNHKIKKLFVCSESGKTYYLRDFYPSENHERVMELAKAGFIVPNEEVDKLKKKKPSTKGKVKENESDVTGKDEEGVADSE